MSSSYHLPDVIVILCSVTCKWGFEWETLLATIAENNTACINVVSEDTMWISPCVDILSGLCLYLPHVYL